MSLVGWNRKLGGDLFSKKRVVGLLGMPEKSTTLNSQRDSLLSLPF